ncbi:MAG: glycosyl hydrolase [Armatimonadota bacterium]|nr:glycosyl hydrolase [Armatimonadota bacterium]
MAVCGVRCVAAQTAGAQAPASGAPGVTLRVVLPPNLLTYVKALRIAGTYNGWKPPQPMTNKGNGNFEYSFVNPALEGQTVEYRLYPGGSSGWDGAEGPDAFKRTFVYAPNREVVLQNVVFGKNGSGTGTTTEPPVTVNVDSTQRFQTMDGFGAALTDSSAWLIGKNLTPVQRKDLLEALFDPQKGAGLSYLRLPIGSSDFSLTEHSYDDLPTGQMDYKLEHFSIAYDEAYIIPVLKQIMSINPRLKVMASPWSAPAWMKDSGKMAGGRLKPDDATYNTYADYFVRFIQAYAADGIPIDMITLQNEPRNQTGGYPSMGMEPADEIRLVKLLGARFAAAKIKTKIVVWDHNWDMPEYPIQVYADAGARAFIDGAAFHGYAGVVSAQLKVHEAFPDKHLYFTESTGGDWATNFGSNLMWDMSNLLVGSTRDWAKTVLKWNLVLDEKNGPHLPGGPNNCRGIVTIHPQTGAFTKNEEYFAFAHLAKFVMPGAKRIFSDLPSSVGFVNPDGSSALVIFNESYNTQNYAIQWKDAFTRSAAFMNGSFDEMLPPRSVLTLVLPAVPTLRIQSWLTTGDESKLLEKEPDVDFRTKQ